MKIVLTGGPSCGKTSVINELRRRGHNILEEIAAQVNEERKGFELTKEEWLTRQRMIYFRQVEQEEKCENDKVYFLDRGAIDGIAYSKMLLGYIPDELKREYHYDVVFVLDRLPFVHASFRVEKGEEQAENIHNVITQTYRELGYNPIIIPRIDGEIDDAVKKRADIILDYVSNNYKGVS